jgi:hypothetical protein
MLFNSYEFIFLLLPTPMKYYWDSSHFTEKVGDFILDRIFAINNENIPYDFGTKLTPNNIDLYLNNMKKNKDEYAYKNPDKIRKLSVMYKDALNGSRIDTSSLAGMF